MFKEYFPIKKKNLQSFLFRETKNNNKKNKNRLTVFCFKTNSTDLIPDG